MNRFHPFYRVPSAGMVLLEVMTALFVFTLVAFSMVTALDTALDASRQRNQIDVAVRGLENQLALLHAGRFAPGPRDLPDDGSGLTYHVDIEPEQLRDQKGQPLVGMYRATITVKWKLERQDQERDISQLLYQP